MAETATTTIRLTEEDRANAQRIIDSGAAASISEAIRVALAEYARSVPRLRAIERRLAEAVSRSEPARIELLPGAGLINVVLGHRQRVLARVMTHGGQTILGARLIWEVEPPNLARVVEDGPSTFVEGLAEGKGVLTVRYGNLSEHSFLDVWRQIDSGPHSPGRWVGGTRTGRTR